MKRDNILEAYEEASRFLRRVNKYLNKYRASHPMFGDCTTAAIRRSSLDLTKALAKMRGER